MNIFFQTQHIEIDQAMKDFMASRLYGLQKFISKDSQIFVNAEKTRASHNGNDLYFISLSISDAQYRYYTEEYQQNIRKTFDNAYEEMVRIVRNDKRKERNLARRAGSRIKNLFRKKR
jgi:ribosome-associated translation inhibitor RaiA